MDTLTSNIAAAAALIIQQSQQSGVVSDSGDESKIIFVPPLVETMLEDNNEVDKFDRIGGEN